VQWLGRRTGQERLDAVRHYPDQDEVDWTRVAFSAPDMEGFGITPLRVGRGARTAEGEAALQGRTLTNQFIEVRIGRTGALELTDRLTRQRYNNLLALESSGDAGDTYTYAPPIGDRVRRNQAPVKVRSLAQGPLVAALEVEGSLPAGLQPSGSGAGRVAYRLIVSLHARSAAVRCSLILDNRGLNHRLRARVPTGLSGGSALAGSQFGQAARQPTSSDAGAYPRETPVSTAPAQRYVAHAGKNRGLAVLAPGFFEYELDGKGDLLVTLLRSVGQLSRPDLPTRPGHAGWPVSTPEAQCLGTDRLQLALAPLTQAQLESGTMLPGLWEDVFLPIRPVWLRQASPLAVHSVGARLEGEGLVYSSVKPAEGSKAMVLRCYNALSRATAGAWHLSAAVSVARRARADEQTLHEIRLGEGGRSIPFHAAAHEIVTIVVTLAPFS
jgi:alpha-mannosidase